MVCSILIQQKFGNKKSKITRITFEFGSLRDHWSNMKEISKQKKQKRKNLIQNIEKNKPQCEKCEQKAKKKKYKKNEQK